MEKGASPGNQKLSALLIVAPNKALEIVELALNNNKGDVKATAKALRIGRTTLTTWIGKYSRLQTTVDRARDGK